MTWPSLICFSLSVFSLAASSITGRVNITSEPSHASHSHDCSGVVVWLRPLTDEPAAVAGNSVRMRVQQKNKTFSPHVLVVPVGTTVEFPNDDPIFHNAFSNYNGQIFDIGLYPPGTTRSITFRKAGVVRVFCNIHAAMSAVIVVVNTPYFAVTGKDGVFHIEGAPKGSYQLAFYYERATEKTLQSLSRTVLIRNEEEDLGVTNISEAGYLAIPHMNKYGKPYGPAPEISPYSGTQQ
jgi:plastocyanin